MPDGERIRRRDWRRMTPGAAITALAAVIVAAVSARDAAVLVTANRYPELAVKLAPANATAIVRVFDNTLLTEEGLRQDARPWMIASRQALRADPLNANGLRLLAYVTELTSGGVPAARRLMQLSERASRRDLLAQIWLIEDAVRRGDVAGALKHYDRALSVRPAVAGQLFPVLVAASAEPAIQAGLVPYLRADRRWVPSFLSVLVAQSPDPEAVATLFRRYGGSRAVPDHARYESALLRRLVQTGDMAGARSFAATLGAGDGIAAFGFAPATLAERFRPLTWSLFDGFDGDASLAGAGALAISVRPETKIVAASRTILPPASRMTLRQRVSYPDPNAAPLLTWKAYCRRASGAPQQFWARDLPVAATPTPIEAAIDVPAGCIGVQVDIEATGTAGSADSKAVIDRVELAAR